MTAFESEESTGDVNKAENIFQAGGVRFFSQKKMTTMRKYNVNGNLVRSSSLQHCTSTGDVN